MDLRGVYGSQSIFAKITRGEAPCYKVYEDENMLAFLDLLPQSYGHTLVTPKHAEARNLLEINVQNLVKVIAVVQRLTRVLVEEVWPDGVQVARFSDTPAGQTASHICFHVIPCFGDENLGIHTAKQDNPEVLTQFQEHLTRRLQG